MKNSGTGSQTTHMVQLDIQDGRPEWTDYASAFSLKEAIKIAKEYVANHDEAQVVRVMVWEMTEVGSYEPDCKGDPLYYWYDEAKV